MHSSNWQKFFKEEAPRYLDNCFTKNTEFEIRFLIDELGLKEGDHILDIGCGTGRHSLGLAKEKMNVTGIDLSHDMLGIARQKAQELGQNITFIQGDASKIRLDKQFDHAICICEGAFGLFEEGVEPFKYHIDILKNVNFMLKPDGRFLMTVLNGFKKIREHTDGDISKGIFDSLTISSTMEMELSDGFKVEVHEKGFLPYELTQMLNETGFSIINLWGGSACEWNKQPLKLDEYEIMVISRKI